MVHNALYETSVAGVTKLLKAPFKIRRFSMGCCKHEEKKFISCYPTEHWSLLKLQPCIFTKTESLHKNFFSFYDSCCKLLVFCGTLLGKNLVFFILLFLFFCFCFCFVLFVFVLLENLIISMH